MSADRGPNAETPDPDSGHGREIAQSRQAATRSTPGPRCPGSPRVSSASSDGSTDGHAIAPCSSWLDWLEPRIGTAVEIGPPEILRRASGLRRPGLIAQFRWPATGHPPRGRPGGPPGARDRRPPARLRSPARREPAPAHARSSGASGPTWSSGSSTRICRRPHDASGRRDRAGTLAARCLGPTPRPRQPGPVRPDRPGPDRDPAMARPRRVRRRERRGSGFPSRLLDFVPEVRPRAARRAAEPRDRRRAGDWSALWRAEAASVAMPQGLGRLRTGGVLPLAGSRLAGTPQSPSGPIVLACDLTGAGGRLRLPGRAGRRVRGPARSLDRKR